MESVCDKSDISRYKPINIQRGSKILSNPDYGLKLKLHLSRPVYMYTRLLQILGRHCIDKCLWTWRFSDFTRVEVLRGVPKLVISFWESPLFQPAWDGTIPGTSWIGLILLIWECTIGLSELGQRPSADSLRLALTGHLRLHRRIRLLLWTLGHRQG